MNNVYLLSFVIWPGVILICAGINMLVSWTFSWSELVFDYLVGVLSGYFLFAGINKEPQGVEIFFFVFSHGLFAFIYALSEGFREMLSDPVNFIWLMVGLRIGATLITAALDHLSVLLRAELGVGQVLFSILIAPAKLPFALVTSAFGFLIWIAGIFWAIFSSGKAGFAGGTFFTEFSPTGSGYHATTLGWTIHCWYGTMPFKHELYHTRQYIYLSDWLIPFWCLGIPWGLASAAIHDDYKASLKYAFGAAKEDEVGNPLEVAAKHSE